MAKTPLNKSIPDSPGNVNGSYTIPAGKYAVFAMRSFNNGANGGGARSADLQINGIVAASFNGLDERKPFTANAGDVISLTTVGIAAGQAIGIALSGFLYDQ